MTLMQQARQMRKLLKHHSAFAKNVDLEDFAPVVGLLPLTREERGQNKQYRQIEKTLLRFKSLSK